MLTSASEANAICHPRQRSAGGLASALAIAGFEATIVEASWYGVDR